MRTTTLNRALRWTEYALTAFVIGVAVFGVAEFATGTQPFYVVTDNPSSMSPTLNFGGVAVIFRSTFSSLGPGSVIAFRDPRGNPGIIVHRILATESCAGSLCFLTKGDNNATNPIADPWNVTQADYIGQVVLVVPYAGYISPALWGFGGTSALLPIAFVAAAVIVLGVMQKGSVDAKDGASQ